MRIHYDDFSPITGNKCVLKERTLYEANDPGAYYGLCMESGYSTIYGLHKEGTNSLDFYLVNVPERFKKDAITDKNGNRWHRVPFFSDKAVLYPEGSNWIIQEMMEKDSPEITEEEMGLTIKVMKETLDESNPEYVLLVPNPEKKTIYEKFEEAHYDFLKLQNEEND